MARASVLLVGLEVRVPAEGHRVDGGGDPVAEAVEHVLDDGVVVDGEVRRLTHPLVGERVGPPRAAWSSCRNAVRRIGRGRRARRARLVDDVHLVGRHRLHDVHAAREQLGDLGRLLGDDTDPDVLVVGLRAPVVVVADEQVLLLPLPAHELVGPGADGMLLHPLVTLLPDHLLGLHHLGGQPLDEERIGAVRLEAHGEVVDDLDRLDLGVVPAAIIFFAGSSTRSKVALTSLAVNGVPSWNFTPWRSFTSQVVSSMFFQESGEIRNDLARLEVAHGEMVEDLVAEDDRLAQHRARRVPGVDVGLERVDDGVVLGLRGRFARQGETSRDQKDESEAAARTMTTSFVGAGRIYRCDRGPAGSKVPHTSERARGLSNVAGRGPPKLTSPRPRRP